MAHNTIDDYSPQERLAKITEILAEGVLAVLNTLPTMVNISDKVLVGDYAFMCLSDLLSPSSQINYLT